MSYPGKSQERSADLLSEGHTLTLTLRDPQDIGGTIISTCEAKIEHAYTECLQAYVVRATLTPSLWGSEPIILKLFNMNFEPNCYHNEVEAYRRLHHLQGKSVPKLLTTVSASYSNFDEDHETPGILLEFIHGFGLDDALWTNDGQNAVASEPERINLAQASINLVGELLALGVSHNDMHAGNLRYRLNHDTGKYEPVVIDFEKARFPKGDHDLHWKHDVVAAMDEQRLSYYLIDGLNLPTACLQLSRQFREIFADIQPADASNDDEVLD